MDRNFKTINIKFDNITHHYYFNDDNCLYYVTKVRESIKYLTCIERNCGSNAKIEENSMMRTNNKSHSHKSHEIKLEFEEAYEKLKIEVDSTTIPITFLYRSALRNVGREAAGMLNWQNIPCNQMEYQCIP